MIVEYQYTALNVLEGERHEVVLIWRATSEWIDSVLPVNHYNDYLIDVNELIEWQEAFDTADNMLTQFAINDYMAIG